MYPFPFFSTEKINAKGTIAKKMRDKVKKIVAFVTVAKAYIRRVGCELAWMYGGIKHIFVRKFRNSKKFH